MDEEEMEKKTEEERSDRWAGLVVRAQENGGKI